MGNRFLTFVLLALTYAPARAQDASRVLVVANDKSPISKEIAEYYVRRRGIPLRNLCKIRTGAQETVDRDDYNREIARPIANCLRSQDLVEQIWYIVTTSGVPLRIPGSPGTPDDSASVDSELSLLYSDLRTGKPHFLRGSMPNPFFEKKDAKFSHPEFPIYLVTRLTAYDFAGVRAIIDRAMEASRPGSNRGKFVIDLKAFDSTEGNEWLKNAAIFLPQDRVILDESATVLYNQPDVIGYASWGSNDPSRKQRFTGNHWLPGAIATEFVSTDGRTLQKPPDNWNISNWGAREQFFFGSPQSMTGDFLLEGATGASGHVDEPYLSATPRPDFLLPAYYKGRNLAESYYVSMRYLSWQNIVIGDPLCALNPPGK